MKGRTREHLGAEWWRFWAAAAISNLGDGIRLGALPLLALTLTDDARLISGVMAITAIPWLVLGPIGGVIVDRANRQTLMIAGQVIRASLALVLAALIATDHVTIWWLFMVAFGLGAGEVVVDTSSQAAVPQLVAPHQLDRANSSLIAAISVLDQVVGVAVGAFLFSVAAGLPFVTDAATFLLGAALLASLRTPLQGTRKGRSSSMRQDLAEGFRFLFNHRLLRGMAAAVSTTNLTAAGAFSVLVILVVEELGASEAVYGLVLGIGSVGGVVGSLVAGRIVERLGRGPVLRAMPVVLAAGLLANALAPSYWVVAGSFFVVSFAIVVFNVPGQSLRQAVTPEHLLGRVVTVFRMVGLGAVPFGALLGGWVTEAFDVRVANGAAAGSMLVGFVLLNAALRHLPAAEAAVAASRADSRPTEP